MAELGIERELRTASKRLAKPFYEKYQILKDRLLRIELTHWAVQSPGFNDHGPGHISRVLENLDRLLGSRPIAKKLLEPYELFLAMLAVLYHDVGMLRGRKNHADVSAMLVEEERNEYLMDENDREFISAAVVTHSSSKSIAAETERFADVEIIGGQRVRPRLIAALVRFADELDEDHRRADPILQTRMAVPDSSLFYWRFCQRVLGIEPQQASRSIRINLKFKQDDVGAVVSVEGRDRAFIVAFAEKLQKLNQEREYYNTFVPNELQYERFICSARPLQKGSALKPREMVLSGAFQSPDFVAFLPDLWIEPARNALIKVLDLMADGHYDEAVALLQPYAKTAEDLPPDLRLRVLYNTACAESRRAERSRPGSKERKSHSKSALAFLVSWIQEGQNGGWKAVGLWGRNEVHRMIHDKDLRFLLRYKREKIRAALPEKLKPLLDTGSGGGPGGCIPRYALIRTPDGLRAVEEMQIGGSLLSIRLGSGEILAACIRHLRTSRAATAIVLNGTMTFSERQKLYINGTGWVRATDLAPGDRMVDAQMRDVEVTSVERLSGYFEFYSFTTSHPTHNFFAYGVLCSNEKM